MLELNRKNITFRYYRCKKEILSVNFEGAYAFILKCQYEGSLKTFSLIDFYSD